MDVCFCGNIVKRPASKQFPDKAKNRCFNTIETLCIKTAAFIKKAM